MIKQLLPLPRLFRWLALSATLLWLFWLFDPYSTSGYKMPYLLVALLTVWALRPSQPLKSMTALQTFWCALGAALFSLAVTLANYASIFHPVLGILYYLCGFTMGWVCFRYLFTRDFQPKKLSCPLKPWAVFLTTAGLIALINLTVLYNCYFPGLITADTTDQIHQLLSGVYTNHHPYYHTQIIRLFYLLGMYLFQDPNKAIFLYCVFQILIMASVIGFALMTLYEKKLPLQWVLAAAAWYALVPVHIMYSFSIWKDVFWGGSMLLFLTCLYRLFGGVGTGKLRDLLLLTLGGMGVCLLRSNGWLAFALTVFLFFCFFLKKHPKLALLLTCILVSSWILKGPVLKHLDVPQPDTIEALSIPAQQIARVISEDLPLTEEEKNLLRQVVDLDRVADTYLSHISDPIKNLVRASGNQQAITSQKGSFIRMWLQLGARYPWTYIKAWVDQTRGYWNGGQEYWVWAESIQSNDFGVHVQIIRPSLRNLWSEYLRLFSHPFLNIFISIGFHTWLLAAACLTALAKKRWQEAFLTVPLLAVIGSLMVATPVFSEFRYAYCVFISLPVVLLSAFGPAQENQEALWN